MKIMMYHQKNKGDQNKVVFLILYMFAHLPGLQAAATLPCLRRDERWSARAGPVESPLPIGQEWRKGEEQNGGQQVNISCSEIVESIQLTFSGLIREIDQNIFNTCKCIYS